MTCSALSPAHHVRHMPCYLFPALPYQDFRHFVLRFPARRHFRQVMVVFFRERHAFDGQGRCDLRDHVRLLFCKLFHYCPLSCPPACTPLGAYFAHTGAFWRIGMGDISLRVQNACMGRVAVPTGMCEKICSGGGVALSRCGAYTNACSSINGHRGSRTHIIHMRPCGIAQILIFRFHGICALSHFSPYFQCIVSRKF